MRLCYLPKEEEEEETVTTEFFIENRAAWETTSENMHRHIFLMSPLSATKTQPDGAWLNGRVLASHK